MTTTILGIDIIAMALIIATSGTILYHFRNLPQGNYNVRKIIDARLAIFGSAVAAAIITLQEIPLTGMTQEIQLAIILGEIGAISGFSFVAKHMNTMRVAYKESKSRTYEKTSMDSYNQDTGPSLERTQATTQIQKETIDDLPTSQKIPKLKGGGWYQTNFRHDSKRGNVLDYGDRELIIQIPTATYVSGVLRQKSKKSKVWNVIQIEQTGRPSNPWKNIVKFEMFKRTSSGAVESLPHGEYQLEISCTRPGKGYTQGLKDNFDII